MSGSVQSTLATVEAKTTAVASTRRFVALIVAGTAILQLLWIAVVPPFRGTDEFDHAYRAAGVASGQWRTTEAPHDGRGLLVAAPETLVKAAHDQCTSLAYTGPDNCSPAKDLGGGLVLVASGAGAYNPAFYWVVGTIAEPFTGSQALYVMRLTAALLCLLFVGLAAWAVGIRSRSRWSRAGLVVAMTPVMIYSMALPAPNGVEMAAALAFWCALLSLDGSLGGHRERWLVVIAAVSASVLMVDRTLGPLFALLALLTVLVLRPSLIREVATRHRVRFVAGSLVVLAAAAWGVSWFILSGAGEPAPEKQGGDWSWSVLILWPLQSIAAFPFRDQPGAMIVYPVVLLIFAALVLSALRIGHVRERAALSMSLVTGLAIPLVLTALTYDGRGAMWQGRYGLPYALGIVLLCGVILDRRAWSPRLGPGGLVIGVGFMAIATAACFLKVVDQELQRTASTADASWHVPSAPLLITGTIAAWLILYLAVRGQRQRAIA